MVWDLAFGAPEGGGGGEKKTQARTAKNLGQGYPI